MRYIYPFNGRTKEFIKKITKESFCKAKRKGVIDKLKRHIDVKYKVIQ